MLTALVMFCALNFLHLSQQLLWDLRESIHNHEINLAFFFAYHQPPDVANISHTL